MKRCKVCGKKLYRNNKVGCCRNKDCRRTLYNTYGPYKAKKDRENKRWYVAKIARDPEWYERKKAECLARYYRRK